jgi:aspartate aminotransferase-like enzyme
VRKNFGIRLAGGQGKLSGKVVRVGHMGYVDAFDVVNGISAIALTMRGLGAHVDTSAAISACFNTFD